MTAVCTPAAAAVSPRQPAAGRFIPLPLPIFQTAVFYKTLELWMVFSLWVHEEAALFNKLLHVMQSDWRYLITMLNTNKSVVLSMVSSLCPDI